MSDLSDFSESDFDKAASSDKKSLSRAKTSKDPPAKAQSKLPDSEEKSKNPPARKESSKGSDSEKKEPPKHKKSTKQPGQRMASGSESLPALDKATGVLSPPDFFISKIVHDSQCFTPKVGHCVVEVKGLIYIFGGEDPDGNPTSVLLKFNPGSNSFEVVDDLDDGPGPLRGATLNVWRAHSRGEPSLLLFGGIDDEKEAKSEAWAFDLNKSSWQELKLKSRPEARYSHAAVFCEKTNGLYLFGGQKADGTVIQDAHVLKGTTWSYIESAEDKCAPAGRCGHSASLCNLEGKSVVAIFGGDLSGSGKGDNDLWLYDIDKDKWKKMEDFAGEPPCPRWKHAAAFFDNRLWVIGGTYGGWFKNYVMSDFFVFDFLAKCWFKCDVDPKELGSHTDIGSLTVLPSSRAIFIFGGADQHGYPSSDVYRLAPVCTTVTLGSLRQDISRTVGEVKQVRSEMDSTLQETRVMRDTVSRLEEASGAMEQTIQGVTSAAQRAEVKLGELTNSTQLLQDTVKKLEEALAQMDATVRSFAVAEKKFGIMEVTIQEALAKLEQKADISSLRAVAAKVDPNSDEDDD
ncbi:kelch motif domain-containing [Cyclospora cayetanensis]|uniref:Kelch motif domain-containing n=1 Tax=Cyclospora cayetanensis TaxID=88456 RepID=A0A1D3CTI4_9EIME|nr:kelch motif domain-containing [Cyclospora cayetanensis]